MQKKKSTHQFCSCGVCVTPPSSAICLRSTRHKFQGQPKSRSIQTYPHSTCQVISTGITYRTDLLIQPRSFALDYTDAPTHQADGPATVHTSRELLNRHRGHLHAFRPVCHLRLSSGELGSRSCPFTLKLLLGHSLLGSGLLFLLNLV